MNVLSHSTIVCMRLSKKTLWSKDSCLIGFLQASLRSTSTLLQQLLAPGSWGCQWSRLRMDSWTHWHSFVSPGLGFMPAALHSHLRSDLTIISGVQERLNAPLCPQLSRSLCLPPTEFPFSGSLPSSLRRCFITQIVWCAVSYIEKSKHTWLFYYPVKGKHVHWFKINSSQGLWVSCDIYFRSSPHCNPISCSPEQWGLSIGRSCRRVWGQHARPVDTKKILQPKSIHHFKYDLPRWVTFSNLHNLAYKRK